MNPNTYMQICTQNCVVTIEARPPHCQRGNFYAKLFHTDRIGVDMLKFQRTAHTWDTSDQVLPRYYFSEAAAKSEVESFLAKNGETVVESWKEFMT